MRLRINSRRGMTLVELIVAFTIVLVLSTIALPLAQVKVQREKERELRRALQEIRTAIDRYKDAADAGKLGQLDPNLEGYPESLEILVEGVTVQNQGAAGQPLGSPMGQAGFGQQQPGAFGRGGSRGGIGGGGIGGQSGFGGGGFGQQSAFGGGGGTGRSGFGNSGGFGSSGGRRSSGGLGSSGGIGQSGIGSSSIEEEGEHLVKFLRRIPKDPMTNSTDWGLRSMQDDPNSFSWGGGNVFDVYTKSMDTALDGTPYREW